MSHRQPPVASLGFLLKRAQHTFRTTVDEALRSLDLTAPQYAVLSAVEMAAGISNAELARLAFVTPQTMQGILAGLERSGLLERRQDPQHGRILRTTLTDRGLQVLSRATHRVNAIERLLVEAVGVEGVAEFADALARCANRLGSEQPPAAPQD